MRIGVDLTACWRSRVGMVTVSLELARAMHAQAPGELVIFASRERPAGFDGTEVILTPHRHELANKLAWLPPVEAAAELDAMFYPYWPSPPRRRRGAPAAVVLVHDVTFRVRPAEVPWQQRLYLGSVLRRALAGAAAVVVPSRATGRDLLDHFPLPGLGDRLHVTPEGPTPLPRGGALPEGLAPGFILAVGTVEPRKNYPRLVQAYRLLKEAGGAPPLVVAGRPGWAYGNALRLLREEPGVLLLGHVDDAQLGALYKEAALLAFPSLYEGFGLPLLDAMAAGLPALIGDSGALPELAQEAALAVDPLSPEAIADGLRRLLDDQGLRERLAALGLRRAAGFSWQTSAGAVLDLLREVAGTARSDRIG